MINNKRNKNYRPCVGIVLIKNGLVFVGKRIDYKSDAWQMPQGGIESKETSVEAALRELKEETGVSRKNIDIICETEDWIKYDLPIELVPKLWDGKYIGQKQKWFAMNYLGSDEEININANSPEFSSWKWMKKDKVLKKIVPFKRSVYKYVFDEFSCKLYLD